jgi:hypothetical protein
MPGIPLTISVTHHRRPIAHLLKPRSVFGGFDMGGDWSIQFGQHSGIKCYAVFRRVLAVARSSWLSGVAGT